MSMQQGTPCMPNSSYVIRTAPLAEALAYFVLREDVVCAMQTHAANLVGRRPGIGVHGWEKKSGNAKENKMHPPLPLITMLGENLVCLRRDINIVMRGEGEQQKKKCRKETVRAQSGVCHHQIGVSRFFLPTMDPKLGDLKARSNLIWKNLILHWVLLAYLNHL